MELVLEGSSDFTTILNLPLQVKQVAVKEIICHMANLDNIRSGMWIEIAMSNFRAKKNKSI